ncbi:MAG: sigma 54-interacting transcriptional regulator [Zavarzinella sp.]
MAAQADLLEEDSQHLRVLVVDDEVDHAETVAEILDQQGYSTVVATTGKAALQLIREDDFDLILTDLRMGEVNGIAIVREVQTTQSDAYVVVISGQTDVKTAIQALKEGADQYLLKPLDINELLTIVHKSANELIRRRTIRELRKQLDERFGFEGVIGNSQRMQELLTRLKAYAPTRATVLILGENGTGKELVAKALHTNSPRKKKPFVAMNCAALNENLLDDEMFGHEPGAFTGAEKLRKGQFEYANGGTLFLDEIGDMPLALQAKLLRVLENGEVKRIGSNETIKVDVRLIAATNRNLEEMIKEGTFRQDLFFRLRVGHLRIPPLRERKQDIRLLAMHFLEEFNQRHGKNIKAISPAVWRAFDSYHWPGNVRELRNQIESMVIQNLDGVLTLEDVYEGDPLRDAPQVAVSGTTSDTFVGKTLGEVERIHCESTLNYCQGNRTEAAKLLGIGERTLYRMLTDWKLQDKIPEALEKHQGNVKAAAKELEITAEMLERKIKKMGQQLEEENG